MGIRPTLVAMAKVVGCMRDDRDDVDDGDDGNQGDNGKDSDEADDDDNGEARVPCRSPCARLGL